MKEKDQLLNRVHGDTPVALVPPDFYHWWAQKKVSLHVKGKYIVVSKEVLETEKSRFSKRWLPPHA